MSAGAVDTVALAPAAVKRGVRRLSEEELVFYGEHGYLITHEFLTGR